MRLRRARPSCNISSMNKTGFVTAVLGLLLLSAAALRGETMSADLIVLNAEIWTGEKGAAGPRRLRSKVTGSSWSGQTRKPWISKARKPRSSTPASDFSCPVSSTTILTSWTEASACWVSTCARRVTKLSSRNLLRDFARSLPKGTWITGGSWDHESWPSKQVPHRTIIDSRDARSSGFCRPPGRPHGACQWVSAEARRDRPNHQGCSGRRNRPRCERRADRSPEGCRHGSGHQGDSSAQRGGPPPRCGGGTVSSQAIWRHDCQHDVQ